MKRNRVLTKQTAQTSRLTNWVGCTLLMIFVGIVGLRDCLAANSRILEIYRKEIIDQFCKEREWLRCFHEDPTECEALVEKFIDPCLDTHIASVHRKLDAWQARRVALETIACFNRTFAETHPHGKDVTKECKNAPQHLQ